MKSFVHSNENGTELVIELDESIAQITVSLLPADNIERITEYSSVFQAMSSHALLANIRRIETLLTNVVDAKNIHLSNSFEECLNYDDGKIAIEGYSDVFIFKVIDDVESDYMDSWFIVPNNDMKDFFFTLITFLSETINKLKQIKQEVFGQ